MALVLCTGVNKALLQTRKYILEAAGHTVVTVTDEKALLEACKKQTFDVAVIGQSTGAKMKPRISALVREHCPAAKILELYEPYSGPVVADADASVATPFEVPKDLADRVTELASRSNKSRAG
jgi:hypothetical protein